MHAVPAGHTPPPQVASHGVPVGTQTQSLNANPMRNGAQVLPAPQLPLHMGYPDPPLQGAAARQKHSLGNATPRPQLCETGQSPGQVDVGAPGTQALPGLTHAQSAKVELPASTSIA